MARLLPLVMVAPVALVACVDKGDDDDDGDDGDDDDDDGGGGGQWGGGGRDSGSAGRGSAACENYLDALVDCFTQFGADPDDYGITDGYCDAYTDTAYDSLFNCYADAFAGADCSTVESYAAAANEAAACG